MLFSMITSNKELLNVVKDKITAEGGAGNQSSCPAVLLKNASFKKVEESRLVNAAVAAEFFYQALFKHYGQNQGVGADIIMGDYYGSIAIIYAAKLNDSQVLGVFCKAIQDATNDKDNEHRHAARLAKIYGASAWVGAYLAGVSENKLSDIYQQGEKEGLEIEKSYFS